LKKQVNDLIQAVLSETTVTTDLSLMPLQARLLESVEKYGV
jgi:hypothetical protein